MFERRGKESDQELFNPCIECPLGPVPDDPRCGIGAEAVRVILTQKQPLKEAVKLRDSYNPNGKEYEFFEMIARILVQGSGVLPEGCLASWLAGPQPTNDDLFAAAQHLGPNCFSGSSAPDPEALRDGLLMLAAEREIPYWEPYTELLPGGKLTRYQEEDIAGEVNYGAAFRVEDETAQKILADLKSHEYIDSIDSEELVDGENGVSTVVCYTYMKEEFRDKFFTKLIPGRALTPEVEKIISRAFICVEVFVPVSAVLDADKGDTNLWDESSKLVPDILKSLAEEEDQYPGATVRVIATFYQDGLTEETKMPVAELVDLLTVTDQT